MFPSFLDKDLVPHKPGVYVYKNSTGSVIYVGKAIDLYHRVTSYFTGEQTPRTSVLVEEIGSVETIVVESELEALILEANLIKKYLPKFNIRLTDDKDYLYIKITKGNFPSVETARKHELEDSKKYFGPFPSSRLVKETLKSLRKIFPWCNNMRSKKFKPCFYYHIHLCPGSCAGVIDSKEYNKNINRLIKLLEGKKQELIDELNDDIRRHAKNLEFEKAQQLKKILEGLNYITQRNRVHIYLENPNFLEDERSQALRQLQKDLNLKELPERIEGYDISNIQGINATGSMVVLSHGDIDKSQYRKFKIRISGKPNDVGMHREMIKRRLKHPEWPLPDVIIVDGGRGQARVVQYEILNFKFEIPVFGLAKNREWLYPPDGEIIKLPKRSLSLRLLQKLRDEAHRFAVSYHRKLRNQSFGV